MRIGIIGSGKVGKALGAWFAAVGYSVLFTSRKEANAAGAARAAGHGAAAVGISELIWGRAM
jgi:8-hydroxy-5-deazaflavin:NADPH oxidoreductase